MHRAAFVFVLLIAGSAGAQGAWVGDEKSVTVGFAYQYVPSESVVLNWYDDEFMEGVPTKNHLFTLSAEWVPIENLAIEARLPLAIVQYLGPAAQAHGPWDDGDPHTTLTDLRAGVRYQLLDEPYVALSPYIAGTLPVMNYEVLGFATGGRHLKQAHLGISLGRTLDPILPALYFMVGYELTLSEASKLNADTETLAQNRSDAEAQIGYLFLDGDLVVNIGANYRRQHGGIDFQNFANLPPSLTDFHDPILHEEYLVAGGGVQYSITTKITVGAVARFFLLGMNTRDQMLLGVDIAWRIL